MVDIVSWSLCVLLLKSQISPHYSNLRQVSLLEFNKERCGLLRSHRSNLNSQESKRWTNTIQRTCTEEMVLWLKHRRERQPETKSLCFPSKNVCHSNLEPGAQLYGQTEQVYSHNSTYNFLSMGHKIAAHAAGECAHDK